MALYMLAINLNLSAEGVLKINPNLWFDRHFSFNPVMLTCRAPEHQPCLTRFPDSSDPGPASASG